VPLVDGGTGSDRHTGSATTHCARKDRHRHCSPSGAGAVTEVQPHFVLHSTRLDSGPHFRLQERKLDSRRNFVLARTKLQVRPHFRHYSRKLDLGDWAGTPPGPAV